MYGQVCNKCKVKNRFAKVCKKSSVNEIQEQVTDNNTKESFDANNFFIAVVNKCNERNERAFCDYL